MSDEKPDLPDANTNPWYVLMTLYGEQVGQRVDDKLHAKNRAVWNAWSCQGLDSEEAAKLAELARVDVAETRGWGKIADKVTALHRKEMEKRNKGSDFTYPGFPDFEKFIKCSQIQFFNTVVLKKCIFTQRAYFSSASFTRNAYFDFATFTQLAYFPSATFTRSAYFDFATFTRSADFDFATFTQDAYFRSATFTQTAYFGSASFTQTAYFGSASFTKSAFYSSATFEGPAKFVGAKFGLPDSKDICVPYFTEASFARLVSFRDAKFLHHYPVLEGTEFRESVVVTAKEANWPDRKQTLLREAEKGGVDIPTYEVAKESCATLRHALAKQGRPEEEHFFFRREMEFAGLIGGWLERLPYRAFGLVSDYGMSIARPSWWLLRLFIAPLGVYLAAFEAIDTSSFQEVGQSLGLSFASIFKFLGFQGTYFGADYIQDMHWIVKLLTATQTVLAFILLFFLGLGLRTRFRLR